MTASLGLVAIPLVAYLAIFTLAYYVCIYVFCRSPFRMRSFPPVFASESVAVLIPALNEGPLALKAIQSVLHQDHEGKITIFLLVENALDSAVPPLREYFPANFAGEGGMIELVNTERRQVFLVYTGLIGKSAKLNWMIPKVKAAFIGLLDADNMARPDWIRTSLILMNEAGASVVQGRRWPVSAKGFFRLWDSLQHHIGCQVFNVVYSRLGLNVFFTGTTALFTSSILKARAFRECLTEDTDLSYRLIAEGVKIVNNPYSGSEEELSPNLYSFFARRRRWANGHTEAFLFRLKEIFSAPVSLRTRLQLLLHGQFYFISLFIFLFHQIFAAHAFARFTPELQGATVLLSLPLGFAISAKQRTERALWMLSEIGVVASWAFPFLVFAIYLIFGLSVSEIPGARVFQILGALGISAPLLILLVGLVGFAQFRPVVFLWLLLTSPLAIFFDICGNLLGLSDFMLRINVWKAITRPPSVSQSEANYES